jgi:FkbM family methyltransferase
MRGTRLGERARRLIDDIQAIVRGGPEGRQRTTRDWFFWAARRYTPVVMADAGDSRYFVGTRDKIVGRRTFRDGTFDKEQMDRIMRHVEIDLTHKTVLEIGANIGTSTVELVRRYGAQRVIAFEPDPSNFKLLQHNIIENDLQDRVSAHRVALSDAPGTVEFARSDINSGDHRVVRDGDPRVPGRETISVTATTLDALIRNGTIDLEDVAMVWMDVQGHEARVLAGGSQLLRNGTPILTEYCPEALKASGDLELMEDLIAENYAVMVNMGNPEPGRRASVAPIPVADIRSLRSLSGYVDLWLTSSAPPGTGHSD